MGRNKRNLLTHEHRLGVSSWERRLSLLELSPHNLFQCKEQSLAFSLFCVSFTSHLCLLGSHLQGFLALVAGMAPQLVPASWARGHWGRG